MLLTDRIMVGQYSSVSSALQSILRTDGKECLLCLSWHCDGSDHVVVIYVMRVILLDYNDDFLSTVLAGIRGLYQGWVPGMLLKLPSTALTGKATRQSIITITMILLEFLTQLASLDAVLHILLHKTERNFL